MSGFVNTETGVTAGLQFEIIAEIIGGADVIRKPASKREYPETVTGKMGYRNSDSVQKTEPELNLGSVFSIIPHFFITPIFITLPVEILYCFDMACSLDFIDSLCEFLSPLGEVRSRKMMGDYVIYLNGKSVITACDNTAYIKKLPCITDLMADAGTGSPYPGAKEAYILDFIDERRALKVIDTLWNHLPYPKSRK